MSAEEPFRLVEECAGVGAVEWRRRVLAGVPYSIRRYQGVAPSGMPVPGLHRVEGRLDLSGLTERAELADADVTLRLEDGRSVRLTLVDTDGSVLAVGHGPGRCRCC